MSQDLINRYQKSIRVSIPNADVEKKFRNLQSTRGRSSSVFAFAALLVLSLAFAYLEMRAFGLDVSTPMYLYFASAVLALANLLLSQFSKKLYWHNLRLIGCGVFAMSAIILALVLQKYSAYHVIEFVLLIVWMGALKTARLLYTSLVNLLMSTAFVGAMFITDISEFWILLVVVLLGCSVFLGSYLGYMIERIRHMAFLQTEINESLSARQEVWAYTLLDLDLALSGVLDFKEMIGLLKKHLEPVIKFDSYILTSLEGKGPKPVADKVEGELFENDDKTFWSEELLGKLNQTRQATVSSEHETVKGVLGREKQRFISYRLDVPVFNDSKLLGIISLRRAMDPFDDLDMNAALSISSQAMMIFKRTSKNASMVFSSAAQSPVIRPKKDSSVTTTSATTQSSDIDLTDHGEQDAGSSFDPDATLVPVEVMQKFRKEEETAKKTITLMSRENADKVAVDRYRTAAVESEPLSVLIIEVDGLSKLREQDGDQVAYKIFASIVKYVFTKVDKEKDILGRYGQNGLSVLMPKVDMNAAEKFAEMIRYFVANTQFKTAYGEKTATLSIGVAAITDDTGDYASMVKRADMALFVAKKNGRNCVKVRL
ncbi:MAG: diguanylate cyclase (GGDEF)-like protein [Planctomycetota bacterium]|jgi:diguanylate cyclase (GGDEF)-like protein